jgi:DNA gyrase/topoisomerase IV subunit B
MENVTLAPAPPRLSPTEVVAELLALSAVEFTHASDVTVTLGLDRAGAGFQADTGRGMRLTPDPGDTVSHAERTLTTVYPCLPGSRQVEQVLTELVWGERGSLGPVLANRACPRFEFVSSRNGETWSQRFRHGEPAGPARYLGPATSTGTTLRFETAGPIDVVSIQSLAAELMARIPGFQVEITETL